MFGKLEMNKCVIMVSSYIEGRVMFLPSAHELTILSTSSSVEDLSDSIL